MKKIIILMTVVGSMTFGMQASYKDFLKNETASRWFHRANIEYYYEPIDGWKDNVTRDYVTERVIGIPTWYTFFTPSTGDVFTGTLQSIINRIPFTEQPMSTLPVLRSITNKELGYALIEGLSGGFFGSVGSRDRRETVVGFVFGFVRSLAVSKMNNKLTLGKLNGMVHKASDYIEKKFPVFDKETQKFLIGGQLCRAIYDATAGYIIYRCINPRLGN